MKSLLLALAFLAAPIPSFSAEWGNSTSTVGGNTVEVTTPAGKVKLVWQSLMIPGDDFLLSMVAYEREPSYRTYTFLGVSGGALQIRASSAKHRKGAGSVEQNLFIEASQDGSFYFIPSELRNEGQVKVIRAAGKPGYYAVTVGRPGQ
jgi:hypothetical protein